MIDEVSALTNLRRILRSKTQGNWIDAHLQMYLGTPALNYAYEKLIIADKSRYVSSATITGTGNELVALPSNFMHSIELTAGTGDYYTTYTEFDVLSRSHWHDVVPSGKGYYYQDTTIGILPVLAVGETLTLRYYRKYVAWTLTSASDMPELAEWVAIYKAAVLALVDRGDANLGAVQAMLADAEAQLHTIRRGSRRPSEFVAREGSPSYASITVI